MKRGIAVCAAYLATAVVAFADIRVSSSDAIKAALNKPQPAYSPVARQMKVSGRVEVELVVDEEGVVRSVKALTGNPLLTQSAVTAAEKWRFTPFLSDGKPSRAICTLVFEFRP